ncbi:MAG: TonB-dependent receptor domain-containing protein, partial [Bacteroidota bacterium]
QAALGYFGPRYADGTKFYNNKEEFFETGFSQNHNLSLEGGNDEATYRLSTNFLNQKGTVPTSEFKKMSVRLSGTSKISNTLDVSTSFNYIYTDNIKPIRGEYGFLMSVLAWPSNDTIANYLNKNGSRKKLTTSESETDNPFFTVYKNKNKDQTNRIVGNIALTLKPTSWLSVIGRFGADIYSTQGNYFLHPESFNGSTARYGGRITKGSVDNYNDNSKLFNGTLLTTAKKDFGKFRTSLMVGGAFDDSRAEVNSLKGEQLLLPNYNSINNTTQTTQRNKNSITQKRIVSMLGNITVNYGDLVYLNLSGRNDWSSTLPIENRSFFYPSAALSFVFTELPSIDNLKFLSYGKFRASYAEVGKDAMPYKISPSLESRPYTGGGFAYGFFGGNPKLAPEKAKGYEVGAELKFFEKRLGLDISLYKNDRFNQIYSQRLSYATGFVFALLNGGDFSNKGIEIQLTGIPVQTRDFEWSVLLNFTKSKTTVSDLPAKVYEAYNSDTWLYGNARGSAFAPNLQDYFPTTNLAFNQDGKGVATAIGGYSYLRNDRGDILISPSTGLPVVNTNFLPIGDRNPDFSIGLTNTLAYKNLSLSFLLDLRKGGDVFNGNEMYLYRNGLSKRSLDRETPVVFNGVLRDGNENTETPTANTIQVTPYTMGTTFFNSIPESEFVEHNIDWLRLRDITINYRFSGKLLGSQKIIRTAGIFVTATDLFLITNYSGADPGVNGTTPATTGAGAAGIDFGSLALPRTITFGISLGL